MGRRAPTETVTKLIVAFLQRPTWTQQELERYCDLQPKALRRRIAELQQAGIQLEREEDPPRVLWRVQKGWFSAQASALVDHMLLARLVARLPKTEDRERALAKLVAPVVGLPTIPSGQLGDVPDAVMSVLEEGAVRKYPVRVGYLTASTGRHGIRVLSIQRISYGPRTRLVALCHRTHVLKWFRADRMTGPTLAPSETYLHAPAADVDRFLAESLDGFHGAEGAVRCEFILHEPNATWALRNLPAGAGVTVVEHFDRGARVVLTTAAVDVLARFLVGLGATCEVFGPERLRRGVATLARGALRTQTAVLNATSVPIMSRAGRIGPRDGSR